MSVLSTFLTDLREDLVTAGFTEVAEARDTAEATGSVHKRFRLTILGNEGDVIGAIYGVTTTDYDWPVTLEMSWDPEGVESTVHNVAADDLLTAYGVMRKAANRPSNCLLVTPKGVRINRENNREIRATAEFTVRVRESQDLS